MNIGVVGERFYDRYYIGSTTRISPEAPVPVVTIEEEKEFPGGAANVANALSRLGASTYTIYQEGQIPVKNRLMIGTQQVARWDERDKCEAPMYQNEWRAKLIGCDALIISDYGKGMFNHTLISELNKLTYNLGIPIFIDTKQNPNKYSFFEDAIFFPNGKEYLDFTAAYNETSICVLKQGAAGMSILKRGKPYCHQPTQATDPVSVIGAGDTVIANFAYSYLVARDFANAMSWAQCAASIKCAMPYTQNPTLTEINVKFCRGGHETRILQG